MKKIILVGSSDLLINERNHLMASTLTRIGHTVRVLSMKSKYHRPYPIVSYKVNRLDTFFYNGIAGGLNIFFSLFFFMFSKNAHVIICTDQGALPASLFIAILKRQTLYIDYSGNYLTHRMQSLSLVNKLMSVILHIAQWFCKGIFVSNDDLLAQQGTLHKKVIATLYDAPLKEAYKKLNKSVTMTLSESFWDIPAKGYDFLLLRRIILAFAQQEKRKIIIYIGPIEKKMGLENLVKSMEHVPDACLILLGNGRFYEELKFYCKRLKYWDKILMPGAVRFDQLPAFVGIADLGIVLTHSQMNVYANDLPPAFIRYMHAEIPVLAMMGTCTAKILANYNIDAVAEKPEQVPVLINKILFGKPMNWRPLFENFQEQMTWSQQEKKIKKILD